MCNKISVLLSVAVLGALCGCTIIREYPAGPETRAAVSEQEFALARSLVEAFVANDGKKFISLLPEESRKNFNKEAFDKTRKSIVESVGEPIAFSYLTKLELTTLSPQIWRIRFRRVNAKSGEEFTSELLFRVVTGLVGKKQAVITGFQFI